MAEVVYILCSATSILCAVMLVRAYGRQRSRLLFGGSLCFAGLALNNVLLFVDLVLVPDVDLELWRLLIALGALGALVVGLVWSEE